MDQFKVIDIRKAKRPEQFEDLLNRFSIDGWSFVDILESWRWAIFAREVNVKPKLQSK